ncbi:MAG: hypothetical protein IPJ76_12775 [Flavobacteriales bacterium]|nr:MAG: hypothetical protein IPJ76_12775 [Flavobacteriales bacterium]
MTTALRSGNSARKRLFWSAALISATVLGVLWASRVDPVNHKQLVTVAVTVDCLVMAGLLTLLWKARRGFGVQH